nr:hypothetical protein [Candidatus Njordarchaeum guaymaensis]
MSEWLGKTRMDKEDLSKWVLEHAYFGSMGRWFIDVNKVHVELVLPDDIVEKLEKKMAKKYGSVSAGNLRRICLDAVKEYAEK